MTSPPLDNTHGRQRQAWHDDIIALGQHTRSTTSGMECHHLLWTAHTVSNVRRGMTSPPLDCTHDRTTLGVACNHRHWAAQMVKRHRAWHAIIVLGRQIHSNDVRTDMPSPPLDSTHGKTRSGVVFNHRLWALQTVERHRPWHAIIAFG